MKELYKKFLFNKKILVGEENKETAFQVLFTLAKKLDIKVTKGQEYASEDLIQFASLMFGVNIPESFYKGFPNSVLKLTKEQLLLDQLLHYTMTYGFNSFEEPGYSVFENDFERLSFNEKLEPKLFQIVNEKEGNELLKNYIEDLFNSSRPLSENNYNVVKQYIIDYDCKTTNIVCKDTIIRLLADTKMMQFTSQLSLSDVIKVVDYINYQKYNNTNLKKLKFCNKDRRFISSVIDDIFANGKINIRECFEKKKLWCGLLHHIHYTSKNEKIMNFVSLMRNKGNMSVYSEFIKSMNSGDIVSATEIIKTQKGESALLRNLNFLLSRCKTEEEIINVLDEIDSKNAIILIQLLLQYGNYCYGGTRVFGFAKHNMSIFHEETAEEVLKRKSCLSKEIVAIAQERIKTKLAENLKGKLGNVYISENMFNVGVPVQENTAKGGFGALPKGSRIKLEEGKKIRAFTYWEKVNDIDLSVVGIKEDGGTQEFSWRTMSGRQSKAITFSGDETSGYNGGSEYFDINVELFKEKYPNIRYLVFNNNVYSCIPFCGIECKAGYMLRDIKDTGKVFEPKTVQTSFKIDANSTFACLFGFDLFSNEFVWINSNFNENEIIAGNANLNGIIKYFNYTKVINLGSLFTLMATNVVDDPLIADVVISDEELELGENAIQIRSCDFERVSALL